MSFLEAITVTSQQGHKGGAVTQYKQENNLHQPRRGLCSDFLLQVFLCGLFPCWGLLRCSLLVGFTFLSRFVLAVPFSSSISDGNVQDLVQIPVGSRKPFKFWSELVIYFKPGCWHLSFSKHWLHQVQTFIRLCRASWGSCKYCWNEQGVIGMIWQIFVPDERLWMIPINERTYFHRRH